MTLAAFATYILQTTLAVSLLIALVLLVRRPFAARFGAKAAYALWAIPFLRLILPPMPANWTLLGWLQPGPSPAHAEEIIFTDLLPIGAETTPHLMTDLGFQSTPIAEATAEVTKEAAFSLSTLLETVPPLLFGLWIIGMITAFALTLMRQRSASAMISAESHDTSLTLMTLAKGVQSKLGLAEKDIAIKTSLISSGPLVTGLFRPIVLLPEWFEEDYTPSEQGFALTHEMMHIKRKDLWALHAAAIAVALQWFNPLAWVALKAFRTDQEAACDADVLALKNTCPHAYGATLVKAARISKPVAQPIHAASLPLNHELYERLTTMKNPLPSARQRLAGSLLTASVGAAALLASACAASTAQTADLAGGDQDETKVEMQVESIFISDEGEGTHNIRIIRNGEEIELDDLDELHELEDLEGKRRIRIVTNGDNDASTLHGNNVFFLEGNGDDARPDASDFAAKMRELAQDPVANEAAIKALAADFETRMEAWAENHARAFSAITSFNVGHNFSWTGEGSDCEEGHQNRTVIIKRDDESGTEDKTVTVNCVGGAAFNTGDIMADLRERGDLSADHLAEIEAKLEAAKEKLGEMNFDFDIEVEEDEE